MTWREGGVWAAEISRRAPKVTAIRALLPRSPAGSARKLSPGCCRSQKATRQTAATRKSVGRSGSEAQQGRRPRAGAGGTSLGCGAAEGGVGRGGGRSGAGPRAARKGLGGETEVGPAPWGRCRAPAGTSEATCFQVPEGPGLRAPGIWGPARKGLRAGLWFRFSSFSEPHGVNRNVQGQSDGQTHSMFPPHVFGYEGPYSSLDPAGPYSSLDPAH